MNQPQSAPLIIGTAGHIDHGKTALVKALTGLDLDRLPEEKARGITVALGFGAMHLRSGRALSFVDVPGHERLVRTMMSGASGMHAVLLCVAADDGPMPQTREHLAILELLGVNRAIVVLTKVDLVEPEWLDLVQEEVRAWLQSTGLRDAPMVRFSAKTGEGRDALVREIEALDAPIYDAAAGFRLYVDRVFTRAGFGTVVTGSALSGQLRVGQRLVASPLNQEVRVRGLEVHGVSTERLDSGGRVAINLAGVSRELVRRGTLLSSEPVPSASVIDLEFRWLDDARPLKDGATVRLLLGTAEALGRLYLVSEGRSFEPGTTGFAQIRLDAPMPCLPGDRLVLRCPSPPQTVGGGRVLDPWARRMRRADRAQVWEELVSLSEGRSVQLVERAGWFGLTEREWRARGAPDGAERVGGRYLGPRVCARVRGEVLHALEGYHRENPLSLGADRTVLYRAALRRVDEQVFVALVHEMEGQGLVELHGPLVHIVGFEVRLDERQIALQRRIYRVIHERRYEAMDASGFALAFEERESVALLNLLVDESRVLWVDRLGWMSTSNLSALRDALGRWFSERTGLKPPDFKAMTGLSRKGAIPLLEWLDRQEFTRREGNERVAGLKLLGSKSSLK